MVNIRGDNREITKRFVEYEKDELLELFDKRNIGLKFDMCNILGFADDEIKILSKKK